MPDRRYGVSWLILAALVPTLLWQVRFGAYAMYPFSIMGTWFHEMGHGLTALLLGGSFHSLELYYSGGGVAHTGGGGWIGSALVSAGGLMGPPIAGFLFLLASVRPSTTRASLWFLGGLMLLSVLVWVRSLFGCVSIALIGSAIVFAAMRAPVDLQAFLVKLIGVQACISAYRSRGYMFSSEAHVGGAVMHSDTAAIAEKLLLPFWFWGAVLFAATLALLIGGIYLSVKWAHSEK